MTKSFSSLGVPDPLVATLAKRGVVDPYPIQVATIQDALGGNDICAQSPTGSGKTLAFGIPLVARVGRGKSRRPRGLVLAPTRELAAQIANELMPLASVLDRRIETFYGGVGYGKQLDALRKGVDIAVGCPGRLTDLVDRRALDLRDIEIVVIDEADRMADMGFLPVVRKLLDAIGPDRQSLLFSATLEGDIERLIRHYQKTPKRHVLHSGSEETGSRTHEFWRTAKESRASVTIELVASHGSSIVFCRTKRGVDRLARQLSQAGISTVALHGDRSQSQRDRALAMFHARQAQVLIGTDVAARGLHVENVDCVVHFDPPEDANTYVHRSGRTGRAGGVGVVVSLVTSEQESIARGFQKSLGMQVQFGSPPGGERIHSVENRPVDSTARHIQSATNRPSSRQPRSRQGTPRSKSPRGNGNTGAVTASRRRRRPHRAA